MTREQIDILIKDEDLLPTNSNHGDIHFQVDRSIFYNLSPDLIKILNEILNWYLQILCSGFIENIETRLNEFKISKVSKLKFLSDKITTELHLLDELMKIADDKYDCKKVEEIKGSWYVIIEAQYLESWIEYLKFKILKGAKIDSVFKQPRTSDFYYLFEGYYISDELDFYYSIMKRDENIKYLQKKISDLENESEPPGKDSYKNIANNNPSYSAIAIACFINGIDISIESKVDEGLNKLGLKIDNRPKKFKKYVVDKGRIFGDDESIISIEKHPNSKKRRLEDLMQVLDIIKGDENVKKVNKFISDLKPDK